MKKITIFLVLLITLTANSFAQIQADNKAGLVITPTRAELTDKHRSSVVTLANNGVAPGVYKIMLSNKVMTEDGEIVSAKPTDDNSLFADKFLRISPRRVTIEAGSNQNIRILARLPKDLPDGEYRSHLSVMIVPDDIEEKTAKIADDQLVIAVKANYGVTIPVIIKHGKLTSSAKMSDLNYQKSVDTKDAHVSFNITRAGNASLYGDVKVIYVNKKGEEIMVKFMGGIAVYTPNKLRKFDIPLDTAESKKISSGSLKVIYQEKEQAGEGYSGKNFRDLGLIISTGLILPGSRHIAAPQQYDRVCDSKYNDKNN